MKQILFSALFLLSAAALGAQSKADEKLLGGLLDEGYAAFAAKDLNRFVAIFTEDATLIPPPGAILTGKQAIYAAHADLFKTDFKIIKSDILNASTRFLNADTAICTWEEDGETDWNGHLEKGKTAGSCVAVRQNGKWLVRLIQMTPVLPVPGQ